MDLNLGGKAALVTGASSWSPATNNMHMHLWLMGRIGAITLKLEWAPSISAHAGPLAEAKLQRQRPRHSGRQADRLNPAYFRDPTWTG